ncbi:DUF917 domain-containing protein [Clostridium sediminicola]|uniref:DUF917 domain-containing protein n=1 Tax=Clostridium sediminicola TaxID=3114879 RepID=UPI0031F26A69
MKYIDYDWVKPLFLGSIFLGAGGGGKTNNILILLEELFSKNKTLPLLDIDDLDDNKTYASVGLIGSPEILDDFFCSGKEGIIALKKLESITKNKVEGLFTLECAGSNVLYPLLISLLLDIPYIDGDSIGRAFPELQMTTFNLTKKSLSPFIVCNARENIYQFNDKDNFLLDLNIRSIIGQEENIGFFASCPTKGNSLKRLLIPRTLSLAYSIGKVFTEYSTYESILSNLIKVTKNSIYGASIELFMGEVENIGSVDHKNWQSITLKGIKNNKEDIFQILSHNENLIAHKNNSLAVMVPDLISLINLDTLNPICNNDLYKGMQVAVIGTPSPLVWKTKDALNMVGPQCFGYNSTYKSLEELYFNYYY